MSDADRIQTSLRMPRETWHTLRRLAEARAAEEGKVPSASSIIVSLIERAALDREDAR